MTVQNLALVTGAYLLGAIPFGLLFTRWLSGKDPREYGSGNIGATNVLRTSGRIIGLLTLVADIAKGAIPVALAIYLAGELTVALVAMAAFLGHIFPVYIRFKGGKGVATMFGVMLPWQPWIAAAAFLVWLLVLWLSRYVCIASISAGAAMPLSAWLLSASTACLAVTILLCFIMAWRHSSNIHRLMDGTEDKIGEASSP